MYCDILDADVLLCNSCSPLHLDVFFATSIEECQVCVTDWLDGKQLADEHTSCELWQSAPFDDNPNKTMAQKRFFLYHNIAKLLGVNGLNKRARLPSCVYKRIKELYPDPEGLPTKVGFKRARA